MEYVLWCHEWLGHYGLYILSICLGTFAVHRMARRYRSIKSVRAMSPDEKDAKLNSLAEPFGYAYDEKKDIFYTVTDAWQRNFGYRKAYDEAALSTFMIIHCLPVYFDYDGKTWLMEFWKGEYGITAGCEVGLYHADTILLPGQYGKAQFGAATDEEMMDMSVMLLQRMGEVFSFRMRHWWLACFAVGRPELPENLRTIYRLRFPDSEMKHAFLQGLFESGFSGKNVRSTSPNTVLLYHNLENALPFIGVRQWQKKFVHAYNSMLCYLYEWYTRPFLAQRDRILFLYMQLPSALRHFLKRSGRRRNLWRRRERQEEGKCGSPKRKAQKERKKYGL